jgi:hypothetical protein
MEILGLLLAVMNGLCLNPKVMGKLGFERKVSCSHPQKWLFIALFTSYYEVLSLMI